MVLSKRKAATWQRTVTVAAVFALFVVAIGAAASGVAAQGATVSSEDVSLAAQDDVATSSIEITADEGVSSADVNVSIDTSVAEIVGAEPVDETSNSQTDTSIAPDNSSVSIEYTDIQAEQSDFTVAEVDFEAQTGTQSNSSISLGTANFMNESFGSFDSVFTDEGTLRVGSTEFSLGNLTPQKTTVLGGDIVNVSVDVENVGSENGTQTVEAVVDGDVLDTESVTLDPGDSESIGLSVDTANLDFGAFDYTVRSNDDEITGTLNVVDEFAQANVTSSDVTIPNVGGTGESTVEVDAENGLAVGDVTVSVNTSVARISDVREGADVDSGSAGVLFEVTELTDGSATVEYTNISGTNPLDGFELAVVEFERVSEDTETSIGTDAKNFVYLTGGDSVPYSTVNEREGTITDALFSEPLLDSFDAPPTNTGEVNDTLYEDLSGDGDGTDTSQTVRLFGALIRGADLNGDAPDGGLTDEQARALNWNQNSPETEVTTSDMVSLFGEQIRSG